MNTTQRISDLILISGHLAELLQRENAALREHRAQDVAGILEEKDKLSRAYESRLKGLAEHPAGLMDVDEELRERLRGLGEKLSGLVEENAKLLTVAIRASRRVLEMVAEAVKESAPSPGTYGANGETAAKSHQSAPRNVAISVDQSL